MTQQHTLGWTFEDESTSDGHMFSVYDEGGLRLTEPYINERAARLSAAAPELLASLKEARDALNGAPNTIGLHGQIDAAIAKAEGGAS